MDRQREPPEDAAFGAEIVENRAWSLERSSLFAGAGEATLDAAARVFRLVGFPTGSFVCRQGSADERIFIVKRGQVQLSRHIDRRVQLPLAMLTAGDVFGEETLFNRPHTTSSRCLTDTILLTSTRCHVRPLLERSAIVAENLASVIANRLGQMFVVLDGLGDGALVLRVLHRLDALRAEYGVRVTAGTLLDIDLDVDDIAALVRTTPAAAARALAFLVQTQAIRINGTAIILLNRDPFGPSRRRRSG